MEKMRFTGNRETASVENEGRTPRIAALIVGVGMTAAMVGMWGCAGTRQVDHTLDVTSGGGSQLTTDVEAQQELRQEAIEFLRMMASHEYAGYRANAIEGLSEDAVAGEEAARTALADPNLGVRFSAAMVIGQKRFVSSAALTHALLSDEDPSVRAAAVFALRRNGYEVDLSLLASLLKSPDMMARGNAALILGELGDPSAIPMLREALLHDAPRASVQSMRIAQLQIAEALVRLGDESAVSRIRAHLYTRDPSDGEVLAFAAAIIGRVGDHRSMGDLVKILAMWKQYKNSAEVRLAAMASLAELGEPPAIEMVTEYLDPAAAKGLSDETAVAIHVQAAFALGEIGTAEVLPELAMLMRREAEDPVRLQAAAGILKVVEAGVMSADEEKAGTMTDSTLGAALEDGGKKK